MERAKHLSGICLLLTCLLLQAMGCAMHRPAVVATLPSELVSDEEVATAMTSAATLASLAPLPAPTPEPPPYAHTVRWKGETLSLIAQWYTGDIAAWKALADYNRLSDPKTIKIGDRILIPELLVKNRNPMPHEQVTMLGKQALPSSTKGKTTAGNPTGSLPPGHGITTLRASRPEMELFGPDDIASPLPIDEGLGLYGPRE